MSKAGMAIGCIKVYVAAYSLHSGVALLIAERDELERLDHIGHREP